MVGTAGGYSYLSVNAFNPWALVGAGGNRARWRRALALVGRHGAAAGAGARRGHRGGPAGGRLPVGHAARRAPRRPLDAPRWPRPSWPSPSSSCRRASTSATSSRSSPSCRCWPWSQRRWVLALLLLSVGAFINLHAILTMPLYGTDNVSALPLGDLFRSRAARDRLGAAADRRGPVGCLAAAPVAAHEPGWLRRPRGAPARGGRQPATAGAAWQAPGRPGPWPAAGSPDLVGPPSASPALGPRPSVLDWLVDRLDPPPRCGRTAAAALAARAVPAGIDRATCSSSRRSSCVTLLVRGYRLDQPVGMYFDEVYHARTATEFLQDWEYGSRTPSTSSRTRISPSTPWPGASAWPAATRSRARTTSGCRSSMRSSSVAGRTRQRGRRVRG